MDGVNERIRADYDLLAAEVRKLEPHVLPRDRYNMPSTLSEILKAAEAQLAAQDETLETLRRDQEHWKLEAEAWKSAYDTEHADKTALAGALERLRAALIYARDQLLASGLFFDHPTIVKINDALASASRPTEAPK